MASSITTSGRGAGKTRALREVLRSGSRVVYLDRAGRRTVTAGDRGVVMVAGLGPIEVSAVAGELQ